MLGGDFPIRFCVEKRQWPARTNHRIQQPPGGHAVAKLQPVGHQSVDSQVLRQRAHDVVQALADQNHLAVLVHPFAQLGHTLRPQLRLEDVLEILFPQQVQPVAANASQQGVQNPGGQNAVARIERGPKCGLQEKPSSARPALGKGMGVPGEVGDRTDGGQVGQAAFHAPENGPGLSLLKFRFRHTSLFPRSRKHRRHWVTILGVGYAQDLFPPMDETARLMYSGPAKENVN